MQFWKPSDCGQEKLNTACRNVLMNVVAIICLHTTGIILRYENMKALGVFKYVCYIHPTS